MTTHNPRRDATTSELMSMRTTYVHDVGDQNVTDARDHNLNGIKEHGLRFYVE
jgi:hypothetical protein